MQLGAPKSHRVADGENQKFGLSNNSANNSDYSQDQDSLSNRPNFLEKNESQLSENDQQSGYFKIGNPYSIFGVAYEPQDYESFEETGTASWYGSEFHGKKTANGEIYNKGDITAAHPTLPLPSIIRATNLRNGKVAIVRVNDRGPFAKNRIMDFSEKSAELLDFKAQGTTEVKIELLRVETDKIISKIQLGNKQ